MKILRWLMRRLRASRAAYFLRRLWRRLWSRGIPQAEILLSEELPLRVHARTYVGDTIEVHGRWDSSQPSVAVVEKREEKEFAVVPRSPGRTLITFSPDFPDAAEMKLYVTVKNK